MIAQVPSWSLGLLQLIHDQKEHKLVLFIYCDTGTSLKLTSQEPGSLWRFFGTSEQCKYVQLLKYMYWEKLMVFHTPED